MPFAGLSAILVCREGKLVAQSIKSRYRLQRRHSGLTNVWMQKRAALVRCGRDSFGDSSIRAGVIVHQNVIQEPS
ncbi:hypothetical protein DTW90_27570 [Neorhizobium sp. P12A]|nr:hypothetical protein DTW90_27570 [Neorhizobium sp. P12A]